MKVEPNIPPRRFKSGAGNALETADCGRIRLEADELVTFVTPSGKEYDVTAKSWGFYATPSVNVRLKDQGFRTALVKSENGRYYVMLVDPARMAEFEGYIRSQRESVVEWLDERK